MENCKLLRDRLRAAEFGILGEPSAIVPVVVGDTGLTRQATRHAVEMGAHINMAEFPVVARKAARWRLQVMADHSAADIDTFANLAAQAREAARAHLKDLMLAAS